MAYCKNIHADIGTCGDRLRDYTLSQVLDILMSFLWPLALLDLSCSDLGYFCGFFLGEGKADF